MDDVTLGKMLTEAHRGQADCCGPEGVTVSQSSSSVVFDGSVQLDGEKCRTISKFWCHTFSEDTQAEKVVDRSGQPDERNSSNAQIRTLFEEQRQTIITEYCEKVGHHEEERRILREFLATAIGNS